MTGHVHQDRVAQPLALVVAGVAVGVGLRRASDTAVGFGAALLVLVGILLVALLRTRRARARRSEPDHGPGQQGPVDPASCPTPTDRTAPPRTGWRRGLQVTLWFFYGCYPGFYLSDLGLRAVVASVLVLVAGTVLIVGVVLATRRRSLATARRAHPGAAVVLGGLVDLGSMRLMQWSRAAGADLPFTTGEVALVADADGLALDRAGGAGTGVHRWAWDEVELSGQAGADGAVLVLTLLGPPPAPRARGVPVRRRRFEVTLVLRDVTLAAAVLPTPSSAVDAAVAGLGSRRPVSARAEEVGGAHDAWRQRRHHDGVETLLATGEVAGDDGGASPTMSDPR